MKFRVLRVSGEDLLSEIEQYDTCSVFECFHCVTGSTFQDLVNKVLTHEVLDGGVS